MFKNTSRILGIFALLIGAGRVHADPNVRVNLDAQMGNALQEQEMKSSDGLDVVIDQEENQSIFKSCRSHVGVATYYGPGFYGRRTASGEVFNARALTAAHRTLPFGTLVWVTNLSTGRSVKVRINDRGPVERWIAIDLSEGAARVIGVTGASAVQLDSCG
jgi:rare lipoprotein A (peptidoglycan hydrolase)